MSYYPPKLISKLKEIDLLTYLKNYEPDELIKISRNNYMTKTHDSLRISNGMWNWFSKGIGGKSALEYLIRVQELTFLQAVEKLINCTKIKPPEVVISKPKKENLKLILPQRNFNNNKVIHYLTKRCIDEEIVRECISNNIIYEEKNMHNAVFVGMNENNNPSYAGMRSTGNKRFVQDVYGSEKTYSFKLESNNNSNRLHIFESAIDLLSYATLMKKSNKEWWNENLISLAGVYRPTKKYEDSKIPIAISHYLKTHSNIKTILIHFDNDIVGKESAISLQYKLKDNFDVKIIPPPLGKDFNDYLCEISKRYNENILKKIDNYR